MLEVLTRPFFRPILADADLFGLCHMVGLWV